MYYADALNLIEICAENDILKEQEGCIFVYREKGTINKEGWYLVPKECLAQELRESEEGQRVLIEALKEKGIIFEKKYEKTCERLENIF